MVSSFSQLAPCLLKPVKTELFKPNWVPGTRHVAIFTRQKYPEIIFRLCMGSSVLSVVVVVVIIIPELIMFFPAF